MPAGALEMNAGNYFVGADKCYDDYGPMSGGHADVGGIGDPGFCVCRCARFDLDRFDRLFIPNAATNSVRITDNAGNVICRFGSYGNFDNAGGETKTGPAIPLGWPVGAAVSDSGKVYVSDMLNRRVVRVDLTWQAESKCEIK
jgi:hypothetical protein